MSNAPGRWVRGWGAAALLAVAVAGCGEPRKGNEFRMVTESYSIRVIVDPAPPKALEQISWTVVVNDRETGRPIDGGEGRVFASSRDGKNIANGFAPTEEVGTYRTQLFFVTAGTWAMGIQFRRDSTAVLERTQDWTQEILSGDEPGEFTLPTSVPVDSTLPDSAQRDSIRRDSLRPDSTPSEGAAAPR